MEANQRAARYPGLLGRASAAALVAGATLCVQLPWLAPQWTCWSMLLVGAVVWWRRTGWRWLGALLLGLAWTGLHGHWVLQAQLPPDSKPLDAVVNGTVIDLPEHHPDHTRFLLRIDTDAAMSAALQGRRVQVRWADPFARPGRGERRAAGVTVDQAGAAKNASGRHTVKAGAHWQLSLRLRPPRGRVNPGGFDAERHALLLGIAGTAQVRDGGRSRELAPASGLPAWRERMAARIDSSMASPSSRFVRAMALGDTRGLTDDDWAQLRALGLTHLIAISGFHVGLVAGGCALLLAALWRCWAWLPQHLPRPQAAAFGAAIGASGYAVVAGLALPTVRTALMIVVVALACTTRRRIPWGQSLALAALAILVVAPLSILAAGFWLSFGGVLWLLWCLPSGQSMQREVLKPFLQAQGVASLALLPLGVSLFGQASRLGPLVNLFIVPWWSLVVVPLALLGTALEAVWAGAGGWLWWLAGWCFDGSWRLLQPLASLEAAVWWLPEAPRWALPLALLGVFWLLLPRGSGGLLPAVLLCMPLLWPSRQSPGPGEVELLVMDVGQGTASVVRTHRHSLLYDLGPPGSGGSDSGDRVVVPVLRALGSGVPDRIMLSHGDADHAGGLPGTRRAFPDVPLVAPADAGIAGASTCVRGQRWRWDGVLFEVLYPPPAHRLRGNEGSCVLRISNAYGALLLAGDIGKPSERWLLQADARPMRADAVLVPHHGSAGSSTVAWVKAVSPQLALVSAGHGNRFGHPRAEVVQRWQQQGAEVLGTPGSGALRVWLGEQGLQVREQRLHGRRWWDAAERGRVAAILSADEQVAGRPED